MGWNKTHKDDNQDEIVSDLKLIGAVATSLAGVGSGVGDILVGYHGRNWMFEIKNPNRPPSKRKLRPKQIAFREHWKRMGQYDVIETSVDAMKIMGVEPATIESFKRMKENQEKARKRIDRR
jgi:hypothetical protein